MPNDLHVYRRGRPFILFLLTIIGILLASLPTSLPAFAEWKYNTKVNSTEYKQKYGYWQVIDLPEEFKLNTIHAATLPTGKVLLVAGSGNDRDNFNAYHDEGQINVLKTALLDPSTMKVKLISTPADLFCSGHALLQSGSLLVAGGTSGYELLKGDVKKPAGGMFVYNENPDFAERTFKMGTKFINKTTGKVYKTTQDFTVKPASKVDHGNGDVMIHRSETKVFVEAVAEDKSYITDKMEQYNIEGLTGADANNVYGQGGPMTLEKQDFRGDSNAYEFDPFKEEYVKVDKMNEGRWYPSLPVLNDGKVLAVSGLDNIGKIATTTEFFDPETKSWSWGPERAIPTYPALFTTKDPNVLFFSGSNAGYGPADKGREPGFWDIVTNSFKPVKGLRQTDILETSGSVVLPPTKGSNDGSQSSRIMLAGGGGVGESKLVTNRTDIIDIAAADPHYTPGPDLPDALRYINLTVTPWDEVFANGGTRDYRAKGNSYSFKSFSINPTTNTINMLADEPVGRTYHSGSLLLNDGRILVFGGDPLYSDKNNTVSGKFERRLEIYTPPQFYRGTKPEIHSHNDSQSYARGDKIVLHSEKDADSIAYARLIPPSSTTHVTNIEQRSIGVTLHHEQGGIITLDLPSDKSLLPNGWYMLFVVNKQDIPSDAIMINIVR